MKDKRTDTEIADRLESTLAGFELSDSAHRADQLHAGLSLGPYRLREQLGQGGMGTVWLAEQHQPLSRRVAIKFLTKRVEDSLSQAQFLIERQALAMLVHPDIAQIHDAGQLPDGTLFYVMEYVEGRDLLNWADVRRPSADSLVSLFERICQAVHHAHRRGLIHRDIKPGNLLVREIDGTVVPKIIDFGVAVSSGSDGRVSLDQRSATGTLSYMAPEQAQPDELGIDARVDVYALGVSLAVCLAAARGLEVNGLKAVSSYAASIGNTGSVSRDADVGTVQALRRELPLELRAIASCAMAENPSQRYESAAAMAADLKRWRGHHPVLAMGQGRAYVVRCFLRRHRWASAAAMAALLALVVGLATALHGLQQARDARAVAESRRLQAESLLGVMLGDLAGKLRPLGQLDLLETVGDEAMRYLSAAQNRQHASGALQRASALRTLGEVYFHRGRNDRADEALSQAQMTLAQLGPGDGQGAMDVLFESGQIAFWRGYLGFSTGDHGTARRYWLRYAELADAMHELEPEAKVALLERAYAAGNLGALEKRAGNQEAAFQHFLRSIGAFEAVLSEFGQDGDVAVALADNYSWVGSTLQQSGRLRAALPWMQRRLELMSTLLEAEPAAGEWRRHKGLALHLLALLENQLGLDEALAHMREAEALLYQTHLGDPGNRSWWRNLVSARSDLGWLLHSAGDSAAGMAWQQQALEQLADDAAPGNSEDSRSLRLRTQARRAEIALRMGDLSQASSAVAAARKLVTEPSDSLPSVTRLAWIRLQTVACELASAADADVELSVCLASPIEQLASDTRILGPQRDALKARMALMAGDLGTATSSLAALQNSDYRSPEFQTFLRRYQEISHVDDYLSTQ